MKEIKLWNELERASNAGLVMSMQEVSKPLTAYYRQYGTRVLFKIGTTQIQIDHVAEYIRETYGFDVEPDCKSVSIIIWQPNKLIASPTDCDII